MLLVPISNIQLFPDETTPIQIQQVFTLTLLRRYN